LAAGSARVDGASPCCPLFCLFAPNRWSAWVRDNNVYAPVARGSARKPASPRETLSSNTHSTLHSFSIFSTPMYLLGIDTSGKFGGVTLAEGDEHTYHELESSPIAGGTFSAQLVPTVAALLGKRQLGIRDLGGFAVASGPGSFTGLRVGLGAVKGLAEAGGKPVTTISLLEALASLAETEGIVAAALDAGRNEIYLGLYFAHPAANRTTLIDESLRSQAELLEELEKHPEATLITSDDAIAKLASATRIKTELVKRPDSELIGRLGLRKLLAGDTVSVEDLDANYIRRSDAEIFHKGARN
jgi:tRNA threonylcarbamoyladenosine biosynthesis protein TsaB